MKTFEVVIRGKASQYDLDPKLVAAIIYQESSGKYYAVRMENGFYKRYIENLILPITEKLLRSCSYGLMQVMGQTARELGYSDSFDHLIKPEINIDLGCKLLKKHLDKTGDIKKALLKYNGGADPTYADRVLSHMEKNIYTLITEDV